MVRSPFHGSGMQTMTASASGIPFITKNSSVLSSMALSLPATFTAGNTFLMSSEGMVGDESVSSRASIRSALPRMVLISPLCAMKRLGCARSQLGCVLVLKRECTMASAET